MNLIYIAVGIYVLYTLIRIITAKAPVSAGKKREDPRMKTFTKPEAPCIVCETTGEDHFAADKRKRIEQLDDWLKSGLIDRKEYMVLKDRYERDL